MPRPRELRIPVGAQGPSYTREFRSCVERLLARRRLRLTLLLVMPYTRAFSSLGCPELNHDAVAALARRHGIGPLELRALTGATDLPAQFAATSGTPEKLAAEWRATGMALTAFGTSLKAVGGSMADRGAFLQ